MSKPKTKKSDSKTEKLKAELISTLSERFGVSKDYVRKCTRTPPDRIGVFPDKIVKEYKAGMSILETAHQTAVQQIKNK